MVWKHLLGSLHFNISVPTGMVWISCFISLLIFFDSIDLVTARDPCNTEVGVFDMSLKGYVFKKVTALYVRRITCSGETKFQSVNYVIVEKSRLKHSGKKEAGPENFWPDYLLFYMGCVNGRST